jgi:hypothetical protein
VAKRGHHLSAATRKKISARLKGRHHKRVAGHRKRKPMSAAERKKISLREKGKHHKGHRMSAAARAKLSKALKGRHHKRTSKKTAAVRKRTAGHGRRAGTTRQHPAYGKGATRFHKARRQMEHAKRHHARRQLERATRHQVRHQRTRQHKARQPRRRRR